MRPDYRIGTHDAMLHRSEVHRPPLPAHQAIVATHQFAKHLFHRHAARQRMSMPALRANAEIARLHSLRAAGGNCLLTEGQMTRAFHTIMQAQVEGTLLRLAPPELAASKIQALGLSHNVIGKRRKSLL